MSRGANNCLLCMCFALVAGCLVIGGVLTYHIVFTDDNKSTQEVTLPVTIDSEGIVHNGPFRTCECSGNIFFGEDRVECLQDRLHRAGDVVVFCIWNDMLQIRSIDSVLVTTSLGTDHALIQNEIPDIHTQSFLQTRAAAVTTVLDPVWFTDKSVMTGLQVVLQGGAVFHTSGQYGAQVDTKQNNHLRRLVEGETTQFNSRNTSQPAAVAGIATVFVLMAVGIFVLGCFGTIVIHKQEEERRSEYWEYVRKRQQEEFEKHLSVGVQPQIVTMDGLEDDDSTDVTSSTAQLSVGDILSVCTAKTQSVIFI